MTINNTESNVDSNAFAESIEAELSAELDTELDTEPTPVKPKAKQVKQRSPLRTAKRDHRNSEALIGRQRVTVTHCPVCNGELIRSKCHVTHQLIECTQGGQAPYYLGEQWRFISKDMLGHHNYRPPSYYTKLAELAEGMQSTSGVQTNVQTNVQTVVNAEAANADLTPKQIALQLAIQVAQAQLLELRPVNSLAEYNTKKQLEPEALDIHRRRATDAPAQFPLNPHGIVAQQLADKYGYVPPPRPISTEVERQIFVDSIAVQPVFNPHWLPKPFAEALIHDAELLCVDPVTLWQYLLPTTLSLMGHLRLRIDGRPFAPNIAWTMIVLESGKGKTRAKSLITNPLLRWQQEADEDWQERQFEYECALEAQKKAKRSKGATETATRLEPPTKRKYVFEIATPQGVTRRLSEAADNGIVWVRDELAGLFKSLNQFTQQGEGLEILLESWDGERTCVDRVDLQDSYYIGESRLSIAGGIQPEKVAEIFDMADAQGVLARFLPALPQVFPAQWIPNGDFVLSQKLPLFYGDLQKSNWSDDDGQFNLATAASQFWKELYERADQEECPNRAARIWLSKFASHTARIAIALHALDCFCDQTKPRHTVTLDTLERAYKIARYYAQCVVALHTFGDNNSMAGALLHCYKRACTLYQQHRKAPTLPDLYRGNRPLLELAKIEGVQVSKFTQSLCHDLERLGYGTLERDPENARILYFRPVLNR